METNFFCLSTDRGHEPTRKAADTRNPFRTQLEIAETMLEPFSQWSATELCDMHGVSLATLKRHIADLRSMGARIEAIGGGKNPWFYRLNNAEQVSRTVRGWLILEVARDLTRWDWK